MEAGDRVDQGDALLLSSRIRRTVIPGGERILPSREGGPLSVPAPGCRAPHTAFVFGQGRMDSRLCGNDGTSAPAAIPAKAGIH